MSFTLLEDGVLYLALVEILSGPQIFANASSILSSATLDDDNALYYSRLDFHL